MANSTDKIRFMLEDKDTQVLRFTWCDAANVIRTKGSPISQFESAVKEGIALCTGALVSLDSLCVVCGSGSLNCGPILYIRTYVQIARVTVEVIVVEDEAYASKLFIRHDIR